MQNGTLDLSKYENHILFGLTNCLRSSVRHLILDEADRLLDPEFLPQVQEIVAACSYPNIQKAVFSATLPAGVEKVAMAMLNDPVRVVVGVKYVSHLIPWSHRLKLR